MVSNFFNWIGIGDPANGKNNDVPKNPILSGRAYNHKEPWKVTAWDQLRLFGVQLFCAGGSGAIAKTAVAPLERIKVLLQVQASSTVPPAHQYKGLADAWRRIPLRDGGYRAFYRGNGANVLRLVPEVGFKHAVSDQFKVMFSPADGSPLGVLERLAAGAATGILKTLLFHPLDLARIRMTAEVRPPLSTHRGPGVAGVLVKTVQQRGIRGLYDGLGVSMLGVVPYLSISLTTYDILKHSLPDDKHSRQQWWFPFAKMAAGSGAAVVAMSATYPLDTLRRRLQMNAAPDRAIRYKGALNCLISMVTREGVSSLYRGIGVAMLKTFPGAAIQFVAYDSMKVAIIYMDPTSAIVSPL